MADALARLKAQAREAAEKLGHHLGPFHATPGQPSTRYANCDQDHCGLGVVIDSEPRLPALAVAGDAITTLCHHLVVEAQRRISPPLPPRSISPPGEFQVIDVGAECLFCHAAGTKDGFCGPACQHEYRIRTNPTYARAQVYARDLGRCADCGEDTDKLWKDLLEWSFNNQEAYQRLLTELLSRGYPRHRLDALSLWDMSHKVPVCEGGGACGLENLETLCLPCHARETEALMARVEERRERNEREMQEWLKRKADQCR